jgi:hypothetical protein
MTAHIDCLAKPPDSSNTYVVDHKIVNSHDWEKIPRGWGGYDFLLASEKPWLHAWPAQLTCYMYAHPGAADVGLLQLINSETLLPSSCTCRGSRNTCRSFWSGRPRSTRRPRR